MNSFREKVYNTVKKIPKGRVATYLAVARKIGNPLAVRAVGNALGKNRSKEVPCHRVVRSNLSVGGYVWGNKRKIQILRKEGVIISNGMVNKKFLWR